MNLLLSTWPRIEAYLARSRGIVVPLGSVEQHGPIGLIGTDAICARAVAERIGRSDDAASAILVGPEIAFGVAPFNLAFPGTISMRSTTLMALIEDYVSSLAHQGFERFYFINGHGGNVGALRAACHDLQARRSFGPDDGRSLRFRFRNWWDYPSVDALRRELYGAGEGMHATPSEVAITQHLYPESAHVRALAAPPALAAAFYEAHASDNHLDARAHRAAFPDGRVGADSGLARPDHGERLLAAAAREGRRECLAFFDEA